MRLFMMSRWIDLLWWAERMTSLLPWLIFEPSGGIKSKYRESRGTLWDQTQAELLWGFMKQSMAGNWEEGPLVPGNEEDNDSNIDNSLILSIYLCQTLCSYSVYIIYGISFNSPQINLLNKYRLSLSYRSGNFSPMRLGNIQPVVWQGFLSNCHFFWFVCLFVFLNAPPAASQPPC